MGTKNSHTDRFSQQFLFMLEKIQNWSKTMINPLGPGTDSVLPKPREQERNQLCLFPNRIQGSPV